MEVKYIQRLGRSLKSFATLALVLFCCFGCAASGTVGKSAAGSPETEVQTKATEKSLPAAAPAINQDRLLNVMVREQGHKIIIELNADGPIKDYQFRRLGADRFALELPNISGQGELPPLPQSTEGVYLTYEDLLPSGIQLVGSLKTTLDQYVLNGSQNALTLTLDVMEQAPHRAMAKQPPPSPIKAAASAKKSKPITVRAAASADMREMAKLPVAEGQANQGEDPGFSGVMQRTKYTGKPISLDLLDADLRNVLRLLADLSGTNIVIEPDVIGKVTLKVEQVPWDQVLDMALAMNGLGKERIGNVIRIARQTKLREEWNTKTSEIKARQDLLEAAKDLGELTTAYLSVNYAMPNEVAAKIVEIKSDKGRISVDERTSLILYSDYPARIDAARQLLAKLDRPTPQVLIEARIVTATTNISRSLGIQWSFGTSDIDGAATNTNFQVNSLPLNLFAFNMAQIVGETLVKVDLQLSALETANELKIMAAPRVLTINNVKAIITQGTQIPYPKQNEFGVVSTDFKDATLELQVTPHITPDKKVRLEIKAKQDEPTAQTFNVGGDTQAVGIDTRKIDTELLVDDGSIVVIGGVIRNRDARGRTATPGLQDIPLLGRLFKSENASADRTELLIFISPKIVETPRVPMSG
jgi:type IV pilus assembly protein PilQ